MYYTLCIVFVVAIYLSGASHGVNTQRCTYSTDVSCTRGSCPTSNNKRILTECLMSRQRIHRSLDERYCEERCASKGCVSFEYFRYNRNKYCYYYSCADTSTNRIWPRLSYRWLREYKRLTVTGCDDIQFPTIAPTESPTTTPTQEPTASPTLSPTSSPTINRPNILFVMTDDQGWNDIGYNNPKLETPVLDLLARSGVILDRYYTYRFCSPSRSMILTGRQPWSHGQGTDQNMNPVTSIRCGVQENLTFLPQVLQSVGYKTHAFGKWHLGHHKDKYTPTKRGFDTFVGFYSGSTNHVVDSENRVFEQDRQACAKQGNVWSPISCSYQSKVQTKGLQLMNSTEDTLQPAVDFENAEMSDLFLAREAERIIDAHDASEPIFMYISFALPHDPLQSSTRLNDRNQEIGDSTCELEQRRTYAAQLTAIDESSDIVIQALQRNDMWNDTIFIFSSDNGGNAIHGQSCTRGDIKYKGASNYPLRGSKFTFWEGGIRSLAFIHSQNHIPEHRRNTTWSGLFSSTDWFKTILNMARVDEVPGNITYDAAHSTDQWDSILNGDESPRKELPIQVWDQGTKMQQYVMIKEIDNKLFKYVDGFIAIRGGTSYVRTGTKSYTRSRYVLPPELDVSEIPAALFSTDVPDCESSPCIFDLTNDQSETTTITNSTLSNIFQDMVEHYKPQYVSLYDSGLCEIEFVDENTQIDDSYSMEHAKNCGFFVPWLNDDGTYKTQCF